MPYKVDAHGGYVALGVCHPATKSTLPKNIHKTQNAHDEVKLSLWAGLVEVICLCLQLALDRISSSRMWTCTASNLHPSRLLLTWRSSCPSMGP